MFHVPENFRITSGKMRTTKEDGNNGMFFVRTLKFKNVLRVIATDGEGWEHVSVSLQDRCPTWDEMAYIKNLFWDSEDFVIQMHPAESDYINLHPYCLHMWRKCGTNDFCEKPSPHLVGIKTSKPFNPGSLKK